MLRHDRYDKIKEQFKYSDEDLSQKGIYRIHPSFRVIGLAEPPQIGNTQGQWLNPESLTLFLYHEMRTLTQKETNQLITQLVSFINRFYCWMRFM